MRKYIIASVLGLVLLSSGCSNETKSATVDEVRPTIEGVVAETVLDLDINDDGAKDYIRVELSDGETEGDDAYFGKYMLHLVSDYEVIDSIPLNIDREVKLQKDFEIKYHDYNGDGDIDFNIGYIENDQGYYRFFTIDKDNKLKQLTMLNYSWLPSYYAESSHLFKMNDGDILNFYKVDDEYLYQNIIWFGDELFRVSYERYSDVNYEEIDKDSINNRLNRLKGVVGVKTSSRDIIDLDSDDIRWFINNWEIWYTYSFMNKISGEHIDIINRINDFRSNNDMEYINKRFSNGTKVENMSLKEFRNAIKGLYYDDENKHAVFSLRKQITMKDAYKAIYGSSHNDYFIFIYDEKDRYLDGYTWSANMDKDIKVRYHPRHDAFEISPVRFSRGTGTSIYGGKWIQVYQDQIIDILSYIESGYFCNYHYPSYDSKFEIINKAYDKDTGNLEISYKVAIIFMNNESLDISTIKNITYSWSEVKQQFDIYSNDIFELIDDYILDENIHEELLGNNKQEIVDLIYGEASMDTYRGITSLLVQCKPGDERDYLLSRLKHYFQSIYDDSSICIESIDKALK